MKKLFFAAVLAIVAVGGASAAEWYTGPGSTGDRFLCEGPGEITCETAAPQVVYAPNSGSSQPLPTSEYDLQYIPQ